MDISQKIEGMARQARQAARFLAAAPTSRKNTALLAMAEAVTAAEAQILAANARDLQQAAAAGKNAAFIERLTLNPARLRAMAADLRTIAGLPDPVGEFLSVKQRPNGLLIAKRRVPLGVVAVIYESRPNVTSDCAGLCLKSGNAVVLRGGGESLQSNTAIAAALQAAAIASGLPAGCINLIDTPDRQAVTTLLGLSGLIDLVVPRGGESLIAAVSQESRVPVIKHYKGLCHTYVDAVADCAMAADIVFNAKVQRPATCNALECLLVHAAIAPRFLPPTAARLQAAGVELRGCPRTRELCPGTVAARDSDFDTEYLDLILSVKVVDSLEAACEHIARHGTGHSEAIVTSDISTAQQFIQAVDAACVYVNASTRFTDGNQFGLGAEMGISTDKLHARGPMGLEELTSYTYVVMGNGQIRE